MAIVVGKRDRALDQGEMVLVDVPGKPGVRMKLTRAEAKARGLLADSPETKERKPARNKGRKAEKETE